MTGSEGSTIKAQSRDLLEIKIIDIDSLSSRIKNALTMAYDSNVTIRDIAKIATADHLRNATVGLGDISMQQIEDLLISHGLQFGMKFNGDDTRIDPKTGKVSAEMRQFLEMKIHSLGLPARTQNCLISYFGYINRHREPTLRDMVAYDSASKLRWDIQGLGRLGRRQIEYLLSQLGLHFNMHFEEREDGMYIVEPVQTGQAKYTSPKNPPRLRDLIGRIVRVEISLPQGTGSCPEEFRVLNIEDSMICLEYEYTKEEKRTIWTGIKDLTFLVLPDTPEP